MTVNLSAQVTETGISAPDFTDILAQLKIFYWSIYGSDADLDNDTQDGQFLGVLAQAISDCNQTAISVFNAFSPAFAQGAGLSSVVKINGIRRLSSSNSQVILTVGGTVGTVITGGTVGDSLNLGTKWDLPATVTIPVGGTIDVTATCTDTGNVAAGAGTLTTKLTPTLGWQTVTNAAAATPGSPVESDADLRRRQTLSTSDSALTIIDSLYGNIANLEGVARLKIYENDTDATDGNGVPSHSISVVVQGGDAVAIATKIAEKKAPGTGTYGSVTEVIVDSRGVPNTIRFYPLALDTIAVVVTVKALAGFVSSTGNLALRAVAQFISTLDIGEKSYTGRLYSPANLNGDAALSVSGLKQSELDLLAKTFNVTSITQNGTGADVAIAFNRAAHCDYPGSITIVVT